MNKPGNNNQGEGDRASAARYNEDQRQFVQQHDESERARMAREAQPRSGAEARELRDAEAAGRARSQGGDESDAMLRPDGSAEDAPAARGGADASEAESGDSGRPGGTREARGRDEHNGSRRRGRFLRRRR
jgi:hypothetical protein